MPRGVDNGYVVYVGWQSVRHHEDYHRSDHFRAHRIVLRLGCRGWVEYGHVVFVEVRRARWREERDE